VCYNPDFGIELSARLQSTLQSALYFDACLLCSSRIEFALEGGKEAFSFFLKKFAEI